MKRISATDALFLDIESPNTPMIIGGMFILDPSTAEGSFVRHRDILKYVEERLHYAPNLRRKLIYNPSGLDEPRLIEDPDFDLEFHVRHIALPKPRDWRQLKILTSRLISRPMDMHRPLWEMYIIEGLEQLDGVPDDAFAMLFKMHHATFDGKAGGAALWAFMQDTPDAKPTGSVRWVPERRPDLLGWTNSTIVEGISQLWSNTRSLPDTARGLARFGKKQPDNDTESISAEKPPVTRFQSRPTTHRVWDFVQFEMSEFQSIREKLGRPKMNDLQVALIAGGLRRYLIHHGELPSDPLLALCPINVRGSGDASEGGNHVSGMRVALPTNVEDPLKRLQLVAQSTLQGKSFAHDIGPNFFGNVLALYPYSIRSRALKWFTQLPGLLDRNLPAVFNTVITNAPNPPGGHFFTGAKVLTYAGFGPVNNSVGLFHTITGMDFEVTISATSCREMLPDISFYMDCLRESLEELGSVARQQ